MLRRLVGMLDEPVLTLGIPSTDVWTEGTDFFIQVQLPHFAKHDITVSVENGDIVVRAHHRETEKKKKKKKQYVIRETSDSFYRRVRLPEYADMDKIAAHLADGTLTVTVPLGTLPGSTSIPITTGKPAS